jgi:hypothetical protein
LVVAESDAVTSRLWGTMKRLRGDVAVLLIVAALATYVLMPVPFAVYAAWTVLHPVSEAIAK